LTPYGITLGILIPAVALEISIHEVFHSSTLIMAGLVVYCVVHVTAVAQLLAHAGIVQFVAEIIPEGTHIQVDEPQSHIVPAAQLAVAVVCRNLTIP